MEAHQWRLKLPNAVERDKLNRVRDSVEKIAYNQQNRYRNDKMNFKTGQQWKAHELGTSVTMHQNAHPKPH